VYVKRSIAILAGIVVFETAFLGFVLATFNQRLDGVEKTVRSAGADSGQRRYPQTNLGIDPNARHDNWISVHL
jgi:hypothetical protein